MRSVAIVALNANTLGNESDNETGVYDGIRPTDRHQGPHKPASIFTHAYILHKAQQQKPNLNVAFVTRLYELPAGSRVMPFL